MGRRQRDRHLPLRMCLEHGAYYTRQKNGPKVHVGRELTDTLSVGWALLLLSMLAACGREAPKALDPCARIGTGASQQDLLDPNSKYSQELRRKCDELRREEAAKAEK